MYYIDKICKDIGFSEIDNPTFFWLSFNIAFNNGIIIRIGC